jgi:hypothetical protein
MAAIRELATGRKKFGELTVSTTEKLMLCLACEIAVPDFCKDERDAWERLNGLQRQAVAAINPKFQERKWTGIPVYFA